MRDRPEQFLFILLVSTLGSSTLMYLFNILSSVQHLRSFPIYSSSMQFSSASLIFNLHKARSLLSFTNLTRENDYRELENAPLWCLRFGNPSIRSRFESGLSEYLDNLIAIRTASYKSSSGWMFLKSLSANYSSAETTTVNDHLHPEFSIRALNPCNHRDVDVKSLHRRENSFCYHIPLDDACC